jgi:hypothetical protein
MPWTVEQPYTSCSRVTTIRTVNRPSYTISTCCKPPKSLIPLLVWVAAKPYGLPPSAIGPNQCLSLSGTAPRFYSAATAFMQLAAPAIPRSRFDASVLGLTHLAVSGRSVYAYITQPGHNHIMPIVMGIAACSATPPSTSMLLTEPLGRRNFVRRVALL